ncbi:MAG TPA: aldehyde dehydrogenase family protein [Planctomycetota bacterium]|nr:aldehyde dehydrogenase family protein [Planctomycetota bacterium]
MDADLRALQEVRDAVAAGRRAAQALHAFSQERIDAVCEAMVEAGARAALDLAKLAVEETGYGRVDHKVLKNLFGTRVLWESIRDFPTVGIVRRDEKAGLFEVAAPQGVVAAIVPTTNPTSTALFKAIIALKGRNAIVVSPHPRAARCIGESCRVVYEAALRAGAPEGCVGWLTAPTLEATESLMRHRDVDLILATGGAGLVKAAYSSGKPCYGVGPGNVPCFIERTADIEHAVRCVVTSQTFDYGTLCCSEQALILDRPIREAALAEFARAGAHLCSPEETRLLEKVAMRSRLMNPEIVGQPAAKIAAMAGFRVAPESTVLLAEQGGVGYEHPVSIEILAPVLALYTEEGWREGCRRCIEVLRFGGMGHTLVLHSKDREVITAFALEKPASRILVNAPTSEGAVGWATALDPSMTLGCGAMGGNITSDNISVRHMITLKRVSYLKPDWWETRARAEAENPGRGLLRIGWGTAVPASFPEHERPAAASPRKSPPPVLVPAFPEPPAYSYTANPEHPARKFLPAGPGGSGNPPFVLAP